MAALRDNRTAPVIAELKRRVAAVPAVRVSGCAREGPGRIRGVVDLTTDDVRDPENFYYRALMAAYLDDVERTFAMLERAVAEGWFCYATIAGEPWLACVREMPRFAALVAEAETRHRTAAAAFREAGGNRLLGLV